MLRTGGMGRIGRLVGRGPTSHPFLPFHPSHSALVLIAVVVALLASSCSPSQAAVPTSQPSPSPTAVSITPTVLSPTASPVPSMPPTSVPTAQATSTTVPTEEPTATPRPSPVPPTPTAAPTAVPTARPTAAPTSPGVPPTASTASAPATPLTGAPSPPYAKITAASGKVVYLKLEIADTPQSQQTGLMHRTQLASDAGMVFVFPSDTQGPFWMKDTLIPLSIAFISADGVIVDIQDMQPLSEDLHRPSRPYRYALEVNQGFYRSNGIAQGDRVEFQLGGR